MGAQIGVSATKDLGLGHAVRANIEFKHFGSKKVNSGAQEGLKNKDIKKDAQKDGVTQAEQVKSIPEQEAVVDQNGNITTPAKNYIPGKEVTKWERAQTKVNAGSIGVDYIYHLNKQDDGFYVLAGIDVERTNTENKTIEKELIARGEKKKEGSKKIVDQKWTKWETLKDVEKTKAHKNKVGFKLGVGYDLDKNMGVEATYSMHKHKTLDNKSDKHGVFGLGLTYKF